MSSPEVWHGFDGRAAHYARRWDYAPEAIDAILAITQLGPGAAMADLGAGPGTLSRLFAERLGRIYAVEPNPDMRSAASAALQGHNGVVVSAGFAEATGLPDHCVDLAAAGRSLHWFDPAPTRRELQRILRPGGWLAMLQIRTTDSALREAMDQLHHRPGGWGPPDYWKDMPEFDAAAFFDGLDFISLRFPGYEKETWPEFLARVQSFSWTPQPGHPAYAEFESAARAIFEAHAVSGVLGVTVATEVLIKQLIPPAAASSRRLPSAPLALAAAGGPGGQATDLLPAIDPEGSIAERFETVVELLPHKVAIRADGVDWTYSQLNRLANQIARRVVAASPDPERPVPLCFRDSITAITALLGVLKAGRTYCPLNLNQPAERLQARLAQLDPAVVLVDAGGLAVIEPLPAGAWRTLVIDPEQQDGPVANLGWPISPDLAAVIHFTSGSTGQPKGIIRSQRFILHRVLLSCDLLGVRPDDHITMLFDIAFGAGTGDAMLALLSGATLEPYSVARRGVLPLADWLRRQDITILHLPVALFRQLLEGLEPDETFPSVRRVTPSGRLFWRDVDGLLRHFSPDCRLSAQLSSTETSLLTQMLVDRSTPRLGEIVPVGYPVAGKEVWLADEAGRRIHDGREGEIVVESKYLFSGYWGEPGADLPARNGAARVHRTGDFARWLPDGSLAFIGRHDARVKVRGFRVDLTEIDNALVQSGLAAQQAVVAVPDRVGELQIVAYVQPTSDSIDTRAVRRALAERLPDYMLPAHIVLVSTLPLTPGGKVDRARLPAVGRERPTTEVAWLGPRTPLEAELCRIWSEVLGVDGIGVDDDFLDLGGDSLQATGIVARVMRQIGVDLPPQVLLEAPTVAQMAALLSAAEQGHEAPDRDGIRPEHAGARTTALPRATPRRQRPPITPLADRSTAPLSFAQQRMWFLDRLEREHAVYNMPGTYFLRGPLDVAALQQGLTQIMARHEVLRTVYRADAGLPRAVVLPAAEFDLPLVDLRDLPAGSRLEAALSQADAERRVPFDLAADRMLRARLWQLGDTEYLFQVTKHHIASDAWSFNVFWRELRLLYEAALSGTPADLPALGIQYADFAAWQRGWLQGAVLEDQLAYWRQQLAGLSPLAMPLDFPRPATERHRGAAHRFTLPLALTSALSDLARQCGATLYMTVLAAFQVLLQRHAGQDDIAVGTPVANRDQVETEALIGFFANTLVLRTDLSGNPSFRELVGRVRQTSIGAIEHQALPFEQLVAELNPERQPDRHPLFQVLFQLLHAPTATPELARLQVERRQMASSAARFDLELTLRETPDGFNGGLIYNADLFTAPTIERLVGHFATLLDAICADPDQGIAQLPLLTEGERQQVLATWSTAPAPYPRDRCVHELFEEQARRTPDAVALVSAGAVTSYGELDEQANRLARTLGAAGAGPGELVGVCLPRSAELITTLLAVLKTGAAYLPVDPGHAPAHLAAVLADAGARLVVSLSRLADRLPAVGVHPIFLDLFDPLAEVADGGPPAAQTTSDDLAYVMVTSGSTGRPKGVEVRHRSIVRLAYGLDDLGADWYRVVLALAPVAFDASTFEIWGPLLRGGCLVLAPDGLPDLPEVEALIRRHGVGTMWLTAGLFNSIVESRPATLRGLRTLLVGGETLSVRHVRLAQAALPGTQLVNGYGPTEGTTFTCIYPIPNPWPAELHGVPIGRPLANTRVLVLDTHQQPVPIGVPGELYIGGDGLARGYRSQPDATAQRFVADPFHQGERLYRSGDRVCWRADGTLAYLGRFDDQVKIRGYRVEPGEVAAVLLGHPALADCAVVVHSDSRGNKQLAAYYVPRAGQAPAESELADFLHARLPGYMVPSAFMALASLPLNANGKLDRRALPEPRPTDARRAAPTLPDMATGSATVRILESIWSALLGVDTVGLDDSFFDLGGHSLLAVQLFARIEARFGRRLPLGLLFEGPTIRHLAAALDEADGSADWRTLVAIQPQGSRPPFFCVHGFGGGVLGYADLAQRLDPDQPFFGLQAAGLDGEETADSSIEAMAARYVAAMRSHQPAGPYRIGGYCFGGVVALDMARQLEAAGDEVALLAIIEGYAPAPLKPRGNPFDLDRLPVIWRNLPFWYEDYLSLGAGGIRRRIERKLRQPAASLSPQDLVEDDLSLLPDHHFELVRLHVAALRNYRPQPYGGTMTLFTARGRTISKALFGSLDPYHGWGELARGGVILRPVDGGHRNLHLAPHVESLAAALQASLDAPGELS
jgi:amino acid adenylation domain-containing protein